GSPESADIPAPVMNSRRRARLIAWTILSTARSSFSGSAGTVSDRSIWHDVMVILTVADLGTLSPTGDSARTLPNLYHIAPSRYYRIPRVFIFFNIDVTDKSPE